jgi:hypothetical protein
MSKPILELVNWSLVVTGVGPYSAPEMGKIKLTGYRKICGIIEEEVVMTSTVLMFDPVRMVAETRNTIYNLFDVDREFLEFVTSEGHSLSEYAFDHRLS